MSKSANFSGSLHYHTVVDLKPLIQKVESIGTYYTDTANFDRLTIYKIYE